MEVKLINYTPDCVNTMSTAVGKCYDREPSKFTVQKCIGKKHTSVTEHSYFSFEVSGVSRTLLAQITRHRHLSFTVLSQRYVRQSTYITPKTILDNAEANNLFNDSVLKIFSTYNQLIDMGVPKEDARFILPEATETKFVVSGNYRSWMEFCEKRLDKHAQWEIRDLAFKVDKLIHKVTPLKRFAVMFGYGDEVKDGIWDI